MATSPTILASASTSTASAPSAAETGKLHILPLLGAAALGVVIWTIAIGGAAYYLVHSGRVPMWGGAVHKAEVIAPVTTHIMALEPLLVNLADSGGNSYLRVAMTLRVADMTAKSDAKSKEDKSKNNDNASESMAEVRDTALAVLGIQTADRLMAVDGKEYLKTALKKAFADHNTDLKVVDVFFTDFLVQR